MCILVLISSQHQHDQRKKQCREADRIGNYRQHIDCAPYVYNCSMPFAYQRAGDLSLRAVERKDARKSG